VSAVQYSNHRPIMHCSNFGFFETVSCTEVQVKNMEVKIAESKGISIMLKTNGDLFRICFSANMDLSFC